MQQTEKSLSTAMKVNPTIFHTQACGSVCLRKENAGRLGENQQPLRVEAPQASEHLNLSPPTAVSVWRRALATTAP